MKKIFSIISVLFFIVITLIFITTANNFANSGYGKFVKTGELNQLRAHHTATLLPDGNVLIVGGYHDFKDLKSAELYLTKEGKFVSTGDLNIGRSRHTAHLLANGKILILGGEIGIAPVLGDTETDSIEVYDYKTGKFSFYGHLLQKRSGHKSVMLKDGKIFIYGGSSKKGAYAEIYDPKTNKSKYTSQMYYARQDCELTLLKDGRVLITGGEIAPNPSDKLSRTLKPFKLNGVNYAAGGPTETTEIYDPTTNKFALINNMNEKRRNHSGILLPNGNVLIIGGDNPEKGYELASAIMTIELFNPKNNRFKVIGHLNNYKGNPKLATLKNKYVLIIGGDIPEIFNISNNKTFITDKMVQNRGSYTITKLYNGNILIVGGNYYGSPKTRIAELFKYNDK